MPYGLAPVPISRRRRRVALPNASMGMVHPSVGAIHDHGVGLERFVRPWPRAAGNPPSLAAMADRGGHRSMAGYPSAKRR